MKPSHSTIASAAVGVPLATIISWLLNTFAHVEVPGTVEAAFGAVLAALVGYFFVGGKAVDTEDEDPNNQSGFARPLMLALLLAVSVPAVVTMHGCTTLGVPTPQTFSERVAAGYVGVTTVRDSATTLLQAGSITADDARNIQAQADNVRAGLDIARTVSSVDPTAADAKLQATLQILTALDSYLRTRS